MYFFHLSKPSNMGKKNLMV